MVIFGSELKAVILWGEQLPWLFHIADDEREADPFLPVVGREDHVVLARRVYWSINMQLYNLLIRIIQQIYVLLKFFLFFADLLGPTPCLVFF